MTDHHDLHSTDEGLTTWQRDELQRLVEATHFADLHLASVNDDHTPAHDPILTRCQPCRDLRARLLPIVCGDAEVDNLKPWHDACDAVDVPHYPEALVHHHRNNGDFIRTLDEDTERLGLIISVAVSHGYVNISDLNPTQREALKTARRLAAEHFPLAGDFNGHTDNQLYQLRADPTLTTRQRDEVINELQRRETDAPVIDQPGVLGYPDGREEPAILRTTLLLPDTSPVVRALHVLGLQVERRIVVKGWKIESRGYREFADVHLFSESNLESLRARILSDQNEPDWQPHITEVYVEERVTSDWRRTDD